MNKILKSIFILLLSTATFAQATKLPDISVIGNLLATSSDESKTFEVKEIEFSFQHYLYSGVKANIFAALHKEESGERAFELEEAYVDFSNVSDVVFGISQKEFQLGAIIGKKFLNIGS